MNVNQFKFKTEGYEPFLDFLKGCCILFVIGSHCLPAQQYILYPIWGQMAVPLFLLIQSFHVFKKEDVSLDKKSFVKLVNRILLPFFLVTSVAFLLKMIQEGGFTYNLLKQTIVSGGIGPGSYYPWLYLQFFLLLPIVFLFINKFSMNLLLSGIIFILISELLELLCWYINTILR